jgi:uncharacterized repeat protein (TIGR02543 family)
MNKFRLFSALTAVAFIGLSLPALPATAADNSGLNVVVYTYGGGGEPDRVTTYPVCDSAWTHVDKIDVDYDDYGGVVAGCQTDHVIVHYTGFVTFPSSGAYTFTAPADDGFWMSLDGTAIITNDWRDKGRDGDQYPATIEKDHEYAFDAWFYENGGGANVTLEYKPEGASDFIVVPKEFLTTVATPKTFDVAFDTEGGDAISTVTYNVGSPALTLPTPTKEGFIFSGWAKDSLDGLIIDTDTYTPDAPVTLHAIWTKVINTDDVKRTLAETGFSPLPLVLFASLFVIAGLLVIRKTKRSN